MPSITDLLVTWVDDIRKEQERQDREITRVKAYMKAVYILIVLLIGAGGVIVALLAHLKNVAS